MSPINGGGEMLSGLSKIAKGDGLGPSPYLVYCHSPRTKQRV